MKIVIKSEFANMRSTPEIASNVLGVIQKGKLLEAQKTEDGWFVCQFYINASVAAEIIETKDSTTIPYFSQWDPDANGRSADCGQTCVKQIAAYLGIDVRTNDLRYQSQANGISSAQDLVKNFELIKIQAKTLNLEFDEKPKFGDICLMNYGALNRADVQDKHFFGLHWLVYLGETEDHVYVNDPDWSGSRRNEGSNKQYHMADWKIAFSNTKRTVVRAI